MTNYVLLNNVEHGSLRTVNRYFPEAGDNKTAVMTFPTEFVEVQREYPILLSRDSKTGEYQAVVLLGLLKDENLFLGGDRNGWHGSYVPAILARGPFIIGFQEQPEEEGREPEPMIYVDLDSPKVSEKEGEPLFLEFGGNSAYLEYISGVLRTIQQGSQVGKAMFRAFDELGLIEPVSIDVELKNGDKLQLSGYHTVSEERLANLTGDSLHRLNRAGYLQGAFLMLSSMSNINKLIEIMSDRF